MRVIVGTDIASIPIAIIIALVIGGVLIALSGVNPFEAYGALLQGAFGTPQHLADTLIEATPLALIGVGIALCFRAGVFNVGAEGQFLLGGMAAAITGNLLSTAPAIATLLAMAIAAVLAGAAWAAIAALLKVYLGASETLTTIMLTYVATYLVSYLLNGPARDPATPIAQTQPLTTSGLLPGLWPGTTLHVGIVIALIVAVAAHYFLRRRVGGFQIVATGLNPVAARSAGLPVRRILISVFLTSGALAGLAGFIQVSGVQGKMIVNLSPGYGYTAIVVALLGRSTPLGAFLAALFFGALSAGGASMETSVGVPASVVTIVQYLTVLLVIAYTAARTLRRPSRVADEEE
ncbi:nucleoside ABC transporter membrane protein [Glaciihabitans tibetensis]|uniref:Nucleoside ABC transporter membrane protein n=1 Tax=Glaciihabitans tibetensis TaxID=1266600 RepID=A0A2T0VF68_9MICO|nr:nucleoside ABC transporter membrane protein [Glaciihabitans tibetensis]